MERTGTLLYFIRQVYGYQSLQSEKQMEKAVENGMNAEMHWKTVLKKILKRQRLHIITCPGIIGEKSNAFSFFNDFT